MKRDLFIDYAKGLATLSIVFIHTVFWSGTYYVPNEVRVFSLLFDVPLFFALSGLTSGSNVEKTMMRLLKLQVTYMIFVTGLFFADWIFKVVALETAGKEWLLSFYSIFGSKFVPHSISSYPDWAVLGNWYVHNYTKADTFPVVMGSFWYLKVYYIVTVFGVLAQRFFSRHIPWLVLLCVVLILIYNLIPGMFPGGQVAYATYYLAVFLTATLVGKKGLSARWLPWVWLCVAAALLILFFGYGTDTLQRMNKMKFPPRLPYILWSFLSLALVFTCYKRVQISTKGFVCNIGRNAIFYYFAQGVSSSLIYFIAKPYADALPWPLLLIIIFAINVALAVLFASLFQKTDALGWKILYYLKNKTATNA